MARTRRVGISSTNERYTQALDAVVAGSTSPQDPLARRRAALRELVQQLGSKQTTNEAIVALVGGITATELRRIERLSEDVFAVLPEALGHPQPRIRFNVLGILDHVADDRATSAVVPLMDDPVPRVRRLAVHALGCLACKPTADPVLPTGILERIGRLAERDPNQKVRAEARLALSWRARAAERSQ